MGKVLGPAVTKRGQKRPRPPLSAEARAQQQGRLHLRAVLHTSGGVPRDLLHEYAASEKQTRDGVALEFYSGRDIPNLLFEQLLHVTKENMASMYDNAEGWKWSDKAKRKELLQDHMRFLVVRGSYDGDPSSPSATRSAASGSAVTSLSSAAAANADPPPELPDQDAESDCDQWFWGSAPEVSSPNKDGDTGDGDVASQAAPRKGSSPNEGGDIGGGDVAAQEDPRGEGRVVGFAAFRLAIELGILLLYVHELQLIAEFRRAGIGSRLMDVLETIAERSGMKIVMLTVFAGNANASNFYARRHYVVDEASPAPCYCVQDSSYEIMSKVLDSTVLGYKCAEEGCHAAFRYPDSLRQHCSVVHGAPYLFPCTVPGCGRGVVQPWQLKRHLWTHDAAKHDAFGRCNYGAPATSMSEGGGVIATRSTTRSASPAGAADTGASPSAGGEGTGVATSAPRAPRSRSTSPVPSVQDFWLFSRVLVRGTGRNEAGGGAAPSAAASAAAAAPGPKDGGHDGNGNSAVPGAERRANLRLGTVVKSARGFYTVRLDGTPVKEIVCRRLQLQFAPTTTGLEGDAQHVQPLEADAATVAAASLLSRSLDAGTR